jgi:pimeloyl-ACP methyl ester carboxylesterase
MSPATIDRGEFRLHGHRISFLTGGHGPAILLLHGITGAAEDWEPVLPLLAEDHSVLAPDLLGHGESDKAPGDYSLGALACQARDLSLALGQDRATVIGHSFGGGIAMQFGYQFPERMERLVLVSSGGLGRDVSPILRAATLPGAELVLPLIASDPVISAGSAVGRFLKRLGLADRGDLPEIGTHFSRLNDPEKRRAFLTTARAVLDPGGQRISATNRLYLTELGPSLIVWGERDPIIPARHGVEAHNLMPGSRLEVFEGAGHFPHHDQPERFARLVSEFIATTEPGAFDEDRVRDLVLARAAAA